MTLLRFAPHSAEELIDQFNLQKHAVTGDPYLIAKRIMDVTLVLFSMPIWLPLMAAVALAIRVTSPGEAVIFKQCRTGKGGSRFDMYKFRTMVSNAEQLKSRYSHLNELQWPDFKITNDPRITPLGKFLRKTSLDEMPQLFNVLRGEMSLVGPRPTSFGPETYELWHTHRLDVRPGITGLWQVFGRARLEFDDRLRLDIAYIERASLRLDLYILMLTALAVFKQRGAE
jgi:lipopolysaccharide/colanic/teichoic acid biosynthesis glycosyltransferase